MRISPDGSTKVVAGNCSPDPGGAAQSGLGTSLALSPLAVAATPNNGLLFASGNVVHRLDQPAAA